MSRSFVLYKRYNFKTAKFSFNNFLGGTFIQEYLKSSSFKSIVQKPRGCQSIILKKKRNKSYDLLKNSTHRLQNASEKGFFYPILSLFQDRIKELCFKMEQIKPPSRVKGMKVLKEDEFQTNYLVPSIKLENENIKKFLQENKKYMLKQRAVKPIIDLENGKKLILLDPSCKDSLKDYQLEYYNLELNYENFNHLEIFQAILPDNLEGVSSYSSIGHILHLNLKEEAAEFKNLIG